MRHRTADGWFVDLDANQALAGFRRRGLTDPIQFDRIVGATVRVQASAPGALQVVASSRRWSSHR